MAHNLSSYMGQVTMAYQGQTPWHKLGERMPGTADVETAILAAHLNWTVKVERTYLGDGREVDEARAVVRVEDGAILGQRLSPQYTPLQNAEAFAILADACRDYGVTIESAGALGNGALAWMLGKLPEGIEPIPGDTIAGYFLIINSHDGSHAYDAMPTPIRVVCQNTLAAAGGLKTGAKGKIIHLRHTGSIKARVDEARRMVDGLFQAMKESETTFAQLAERRMTPQEVAAWIESILPGPKDGSPLPDVLKQRRRDIGALVWAGKGAALAGADDTGATAWAAYNAVCEYLDHVRPAQSPSINGRRNANESAIFGAGWDLKSLALTKARELVPVVVR